jgi:NADH-quinone oxidoreductase subunit H
VVQFFDSLLPGPTWLAWIVAAFLQCFFILNVVAVGALFFIWLERKVAGRIQDRLGPTRVGGRFGWLQTLADGIKLISKEDVCPKDADRVLFRLAPYIAFCASFAAFIALPFSDGWVGQRVNVGVFFVLAVLGLEVFGVILAGYASGSKWSLFGAMREAAQVVSYEVPLGLSILVPVFVAGTMDLITIGNQQAGLFTNWLVFHDLGTFFVFFVFMTCAIASVNRAPFDLAEAESELVAGFHTEYSGLRWSFFFMAEYGSMFLVSMLGAIVFLGAWHGPIPIVSTVLGPSDQGGILGYLVQLAGAANVVLKAVLGVALMMWIRWTLPRLRIDQVMTTCLKYCVPLAAICFLMAVGFKMFPAANLISLSEVAPVQRRSEVREGWLLDQQRREAAAGQTAASLAPGDGPTAGSPAARSPVLADVPKSAPDELPPSGPSTARLTEFPELMLQETMLQETMLQELKFQGSMLQKPSSRGGEG